jgi:hypothetical protein
MASQRLKGYQRKGIKHNEKENQYYTLCKRKKMRYSWLNIGLGLGIWYLTPLSTIFQ